MPGDDARLGPPSREPGAAEACYRRGRAAVGSARRRRDFEAGMSVARARLVADPSDPEGLYWLAVNTGAEALERGRFQALPALPEMERLLLRCHAADPHYEHAGPARVLGRLYDKAPALISVGSGVKARQWLESALALEPDFPGNLAFAADFFEHHGELERARGLAERCQARLHAPRLEPKNDLGPDAGEWRDIVTRVLSRGKR